MGKGIGGAVHEQIRKVSRITNFSLFGSRKFVAARMLILSNKKGENDYDYNYTADDPGTGSKPLPSLPRLRQGTMRNPLLPSKDQCFALTDENNVGIFKISSIRMGYDSKKVGS
jgi:hypothetical protein